ncbi:hypothetical protein [Streptosporangium sp. OZ121]|uniref:hypothetical protein n=1 Tax=Streptosporangium sp. OZ121 TaxID=3444183 RepID=UPI003F78AF9D
MRRWVLATSVALGVTASLLQLVSWAWTDSRAWVNSHGLIFSFATFVLIVISLALWYRTQETGNPSDDPSDQASRTASSIEVLNLTSHGPLLVPFKEFEIGIFVHNGPIEKIRNIDIVVSSENTYFQMSQTFKPTISGRLRHASARKDHSGRIVEDTAQNELIEWMRSYQVDGREVADGTVAATSSGDMLSRGVRRIYHAAVTRPIMGTSKYMVNRIAIADAVAGVFKIARQENLENGDSLTSVCFPLLGAGRGEVKAADSIEIILHAALEEIAEDRRRGQSWTLHFISWKKSETEMIIKAVRSVGRQ